MADEPNKPDQPESGTPPPSQPESATPNPAPNPEGAPPAGEAGAVLSQAEVDALIASTLSQEEVSPGGGPNPVSQRSIQPYKFRTASFLAPGELRRVRIKHEEFALNLASPLSQFTRCSFSIRLANMEMVSCRNVIEAMDGPSFLTLLRLDPLPGLGLIEVSLPLALTVVSRLLGGKGNMVKDERNLSEIEMSLMNGFVDVVANEYTNLWRPFSSTLKPVLLQNETSARFLKLGADNLDTFLLTLEVKFNDCTGAIRMAFLHNTLHPLIEKLVEEIMSGMSEGAHGKTIAPSKVMEEIPIPVHVRWGGLKMTVRELCNLKSGDLLLLDSGVANKTIMDFAHVDKFVGQVGRKGEKMAVKLIDKVK
jgi:flagellar motor switch protein FliM